MRVFNMKNSCVRVYHFEIPSNMNGHFTTNKLLHACLIPTSPQYIKELKNSLTIPFYMNLGPYINILRF
jgi:hypothetical protein